MRTAEKTEKICVTIPCKLAIEIHSIVPKGDVSSFFSEALEYYIKSRKQRMAIRRTFGAWKDEDHPDLKTPADSVAFVRSIRDNWYNTSGQDTK